MKVDGPRPIETVRTTRARSTSGAAGTFAPQTHEDVRAAVPVASGSPLTAVETLIALQEVPDSIAGRARAARRGRDVLDLLDDVRDGMLAGGVSRTTLNRLVALVETKREDFVDPGLQAVLDEIDLRARVELAKLNFAAANEPQGPGQKS
jgi:hypothetical protein